MKVSGRYRLSAPREEVFAAICDPAVLVAVLPGCEQIERVSATEYRGLLTLRLPGIAGSWRTTVRLMETQAPELARMEGRVEGTMGTVTGRADLVLRAVGDATDLDYQGTGTIGGPLAGLDSRFVERLAESLIDQGLRTLDRRLAAGASHDTGPGGPQATTEGSG